MNRIIMLGTGDALVTRCYNTCFVLETDKGRLLVDAGGGNGILVQMEKAGINIASIHDMFITHAHTDHILGAIWVIRQVMRGMRHGKYEGEFHLYAHDKVLEIISYLSAQTMKAEDEAFVGNGIYFCELHDGDEFHAAGMRLQCFDIQSTKEKQYGFSAILCDGQKLVCLGDEPYHAVNLPSIEHADWLLHEAFCLYSEKDKYKPYEKSHSTALDASKNAAELGVKNLVLYHTKDNSLATRKQTYTEEAAKYFQGRIFVPDDLEVINLSDSSSL